MYRGIGATAVTLEEASAPNPAVMIDIESMLNKCHHVYIINFLGRSVLESQNREHSVLSDSGVSDEDAPRIWGHSYML